MKLTVRSTLPTVVCDLYKTKWNCNFPYGLAPHKAIETPVKPSVEMIEPIHPTSSRSVVFVSFFLNQNSNFYSEALEYRLFKLKPF